MTTRFYYREGTTEPITITLYDGADAANITGYASVSLFLRSADGTAQSEASTADGGIVVTTAASGIITLDPTKLTAALTHAKEVYYGYVIVVDGTAKRTAFPSGKEFTIIVTERYSGDG